MDTSKIILITHEFSPFRGGVATYCEEIAYAAHHLGFPIEVWAPTTPEPDRARFPFPVRRFRCQGTLHLDDLLRLWYHIRQHRRELDGARLYLPSRGSQQIFMHWQGAGWKHNGELILTLHGTEIKRYAANPWIRALSRRFFERANRIACASHHAHQLLTRQTFLGDAGKRAVVAPCALRRDFIEQPAPSDSDTATPENEPLRILTLARIHPRKGQMEIARALSLLPDSLRGKVLFQIAGQPARGHANYLESILQFCTEHSIAHQYLGEIPNDKLGACYRQCDIYAMTSRNLDDSVEGFGMTYLEAGYFRKPVVGYRVGGVADAVCDGQTGLLVDEGNIQELASAIQRLMLDPDLRQRMGQAGQAYAKSFSWEKSAQILFDRKTVE